MDEPAPGRGLVAVSRHGKRILESLLRNRHCSRCTLEGQRGTESKVARASIPARFDYAHLRILQSDASVSRRRCGPLIILVLGLLAAWLAAGSLGWLAPPLQKALTWLALATIVIAALPGRRRISVSDGLLLGGATSIAVLMTASSLPVVNILAVAILLAAVAQVRPGLTAQVSGSAALAATALAVFRLVCDGSAAAWTFTNTVGHVEGLWAGWLTGRPLLIGASFGGLDFLVLMAALAAAWLIATPRPRIGRAAWAMLFIFLAQTAYLVILAFSHDLTALLPPQVVVQADDISHLGIWTWGNAIHTLLPWNLPLLAAVFQCRGGRRHVPPDCLASDTARSAKRDGRESAPRRASVATAACRAGRHFRCQAELGARTGGASRRQDC